MPARAPFDILNELFETAVRAADPMTILPALLGPRPAGRLVVIGAGKASARMAEAVESVWGPCEGLVITRYGYVRPCAGIEIAEAGHPVPDEAGVRATPVSLTCSANAARTITFSISSPAAARRFWSRRQVKSPLRRSRRLPIPSSPLA